MNIQTVQFNNLSFINVTSPGELEIKYLKSNYEFDTLHLDDYKYKTQIPKIETFKNYTLVVLDFPYFKDGTEGPSPKSSLLPGFSSSNKKPRISSTQAYFFVGKDYLVILSEGKLAPVNDIFAECQKSLKNRNDLMGQGSVFLLYKIIDILVDSFFPLMNELTSAIDKIDRDLEKYSSHDTLEDISVARRNLVVLHTIFKPALPLFSGLEAGKYTELNGEMQPYWGNVYDHMLKIWDRLEDTRELLEGIAKSNESFLTSRTNEIIKVLTIFSATMLPLNLIAGLYGMNLELPFAHDIHAFYLVLLSMGVVTVCMLLVFQIKRWF